MNTQLVIYSGLLMCSVSVLIALGLGLAAKKFKVEIDPRIEEIFKALPGSNCGSCGYPGCEHYAEAIITQENVDITLCKPGGQETIDKITTILGKESQKIVRKVAQVFCHGGDRCKNEFVFRGIKKCSYVVKFFSGQKMCKYGCLGFGDCVEVCPFDAIHINEIGVAEVDILRCTGCGLCINVCPKKIIRLIPCQYKVHIRCISRDKGSLVKQICSVGCIGCAICVKVCPVKDIILNQNLAEMKYNKCDNCGLCVTKCPMKSIVTEKESLIFEKGS